ncbi:MAG: hypothetical protein KAI25_13520, partial [Hyphomicrobiaceae bacterium]|nr:hypothetical protein [Hyphomicrobiaceae bacterium]
MLRLALASLLVMVAAAVTAADDLIIRDIVVEGGITLTVDTVSYYLGLEPEDPLDLEYATDGYRRLWDSGLFEEIRLEVEDHGDGTVTLYVVVKERPFVTRVDFEGNKKIKTTDLKDKLDEHGIEIPRNVPLKMAQLRRIKAAIKEVYDASGFRSAQISFQIEDISSSKKKVVYTIDEGGKVKIASIDFAGNEVFSDSKLRGVFKKTKQKSLRNMFGDKIVYTKESWDEDRDNLRTFYGNRGYIGTRVRPVYDANAETGLVDVRYEVGEGSIGYINKVNIMGNERTMDKVIRRELVIYPGDKYNRSRVKTSENRLRNLNYFEIVTINPEQTGEGDKYDLNVQVKEKPTGQFSAGVGFSSVDSLVGYVELSQGNFNYKT